MLSIRVLVSCVIRVGMVIVGIKPEDINKSSKSRVLFKFASHCNLNLVTRANKCVLPCLM